MAQRKAIESLVRAALARRELLGRKGLRKRPPRWQDPVAIENSYTLEMQKIVRAMQAYWQKVLRPELKALIAEESQRVDHRRMDQNRGQIRDMLRVMKALGDDRSKQVDVLAKGKDISEFNRAERKKILEALMGVDVMTQEPWLEKMLKRWSRHNAELIGDLTGRAKDRVADVINEGLQKGWSITKMTQDIEEQFGIATRRARLIARDQVGTLNAQMTEKRQKDIGVTKYIWRNVGDARVRGNPNGLYPHSEFDHWDRNGKVFEWSKPPPDGHAGYAINCRCYADPVLSHLLDEVAA